MIKLVSLTSSFELIFHTFHFQIFLLTNFFSDDIFTCMKTREFLDSLHLQLHVHRVGGTSTILGDHYLWMDFKQRDTVLTQFVVSTFYITDIMQSRLTGDPLSWRRTRFKLIAYLSNLLGSNNVRLMQLGERLKAMLRTT